MPKRTKQERQEDRKRIKENRQERLAEIGDNLKEGVTNIVDQTIDLAKGTASAIKDQVEFVGNVYSTAFQIIKDPKNIKETWEENKGDLIEGLANTFAIVDDIQGMVTGIDISDVATTLLDVVGLDDTGLADFVQEVNNSGLPFDTTLLNPRGLAKGLTKTAIKSTAKGVTKSGRKVATKNKSRGNIDFTQEVPEMKGGKRKAATAKTQKSNKRQKQDKSLEDENMFDQPFSEVLNTNVEKPETMNMSDFQQTAKAGTTNYSASKAKYSCEEKCAYGRQMAVKCKGCKGYPKKKTYCRKVSKPRYYKRKSACGKTGTACSCSKKSYSSKTTSKRSYGGKTYGKKTSVAKRPTSYRKTQTKPKTPTKRAPRKSYAAKGRPAAKMGPHFTDDEIIDA